MPATIVSEHSLEAALVLALDLPRHVTQKTLQDIHAGEIVDKPRVLSFALLEEVVLVQDGFEGDVLLV